MPYILIKKDYSKIYSGEYPDTGKISTPRLEVYTRKGKILLLKKPYFKERPSYITIKVSLDDNDRELFCFEDE